MKILPVLAAGALVAGCGASGDDATTTTDDRDTARLKLEQCLRKQGIDLPRRGAAQQMATAAQRRKLQQALEGPCEDVAQGAFGSISAEQRQEFRDAFAKFSSCMRKRGVDLPDITPGQGPPAEAARVNRDSPRFRAAMEACQELLPEGRGARR